MFSMRLRRHVLVFVVGARSLAIELTGARLLAPFFGTSNVVWANVIGLTLVYLSLGYWLGGRSPTATRTSARSGLVVLVAAVTIALLPFTTRPVFDVAATAFDDVSAVLHRARSWDAADVLLPITALGAVAPWAIRLAVTDVAQAGTVAGRLYALSTDRLDRGHVPAGADPDPGDRDAAHAAALRRGCLPSWRCRCARRQVPRSSPPPLAARLAGPTVPGEARQRRPGPLRGRVAVPVRAGRARRRTASPCCT